ncbi:MAG TPA: acetyl-CoA hydrolase/transferase C-terminal domain-containing protein [Arenimonas sp.]|uniref:acetyl-CoA hydrolase/transferase C-terminal domain-containing protein n=1 Tax=Arenimonas sp. TaxID=1872635 RepID=UPI002D80EBEB|nr:acetyl-CoA hydrolase/transferase C-terminal domain-containing protein [Arenimonas sp.]HEU0151764.1 acetyl-CoA hydrolase/transferase C-terminal domain-containing protein [Arenimonas sp.]
MHRPLAFDSLDACVDALLAATGGALVLAAPLGLGKPHRLLNAITRRIGADPSKSLKLLTALSLTPPSAGQGLQQRFLAPFLDRHFGGDFPVLDYAVAQRRDALPPNVVVEEFYMQSGALLGSKQAQRHYTSLNYTHVARAVAERGVNAVVQKVAREPGGTRLSLSCNPDLTFDLLDEAERLGQPRPYLVAEVDPHLPWLDGPCAVQAHFFDAVLDLPGAAPRLFALVREPVGDADYAIGLYASALVRDGGTLQIGIGSLSDALCHALVLRHTRNADYLAALEALSPGLADSALVRAVGGVAPFQQGLYGASEMVNDGFRCLAQAGVLSRKVLDDTGAMARLNRGQATPHDLERLAGEGRYLDGAFYLGSHALYDWLRGLAPAQARGIGMTRVSHINELYGNNEALEREQRRDARFFNTCMMMTALGAAVSDGLDDGRVVSGVGGQYNFVAMAHALHDARSVLMFRASRGRASNVVWNYGHATIPRHLRDIAITEYGIADLRGRNDEDCIRAMLGLSDAAHQAALAGAAIRAGKLAADGAVVIPGNNAAALSRRLAPLRRAGVLPDYPMGSDFTAVEQRLVRALAWLKPRAAGLARLRLLAQALAGGAATDAEAMARMGLQAPRGIGEKIEARVLGLALRRTAGH